MVRYLKLIQVVIIILIFISCTSKKEAEKFCMSSDGINIAYTEYGVGKDLIVFVHGWSCDQSYWMKQIDYFKKDYQVITIDLGGHGKSGFDRENSTISLFGDDVTSVMKLLDFNKAYLIGHSMGSDVVLDAASKWDGNNLELILVERFNDTPTPWTGDRFEQFFKPFTINFKDYTYNWVKEVMFIPQSDSLLIEWIANDMSDAPPSIALSAFGDLVSNDYMPIIKSLKEKGVAMTILNSDYQKSNVENLKEVGFDVVMISNTGHFIMMEQPDLFNSTLSNLIQSN
jgi:pimeloyl-ACP methyl ester carboxylesterase